MSEVQQSADKSTNKLITVILAAFLAVIFAGALVVYYMTQKPVASGNADDLNERIRPVAQLELKIASGGGEPRTGEEVYKNVCSGCHAAGMMGAPKFSNAGDWGPRLGQGYAGLMNSVLNGKRSMPARGGTSPDDYSDYELARAMVYMANAAGGHLKEPPAPAPAAK